MVLSRRLCPIAFAPVAVALCAAVAASLLTGCAADFGGIPASTAQTALGTMQGSVHGGQQPIVGASVNLYAASTAGYKSASVLLTPVPAITDVNGSFLLTGTYTCTPGQQVYLLATGGNPGVTPSVSNPLPSNPASALMGVLGTCPAAMTFAQTLPFLQINEVSTVAAAYAMAPFAFDSTHVGSANTPQSLNGLANAFVNAAKIFDITGAHGLGASKATMFGNGILPQVLINSVADILSACVNTVQTVSVTGNSPSANCNTLFSLAGTPINLITTQTPTDTATAALNIARSPGVNTVALEALISPTAPFQPSQSTGFTDLALYVVYLVPGTPKQLGIDSTGSIWYTVFNSDSGSSIGKMSNAGILQSPGTGGFSAGAAEYSSFGIAVDQYDNVYTDSRPSISDPNEANIFEFSSTGAVLSPSVGFPTGLISPSDLTTDPSGNIWMVDPYGDTVVKMAPNGNILSPTGQSPPLNLPGYTVPGLGAGAEHLASDANGNIWIAGETALVGINNQGVSITGANGFTGGGLSTINAAGLAIDHAGNIWVAQNNTSRLIEVSPSGTILSGSGGYNAPGLFQPAYVFVDGDGNVFVNDALAGGISEFANNGTLISGRYGYTGGGILYNNTISYGMSTGFGMAVDSSGDLWSSQVTGVLNGFALSDNALYEFIGIAAPTVTPIAVAVKNNTLGVRP